MEPEYLNLLKPSNLESISTTGSLKASKETASLAMCDAPADDGKYKHLGLLIDELIKKGFITWRKQIDELRIAGKVRILILK